MMTRPTPPIYENILETIGRTPMIRLNELAKDIPGEVLAKVEYFNPGHSTKDRMALKMVEDAERDGRLKPGGTIMHVGLQDWASEIDMRRLTLAEITLLGTYTYTTADLRATVDALARGVFGDLSWVEERPLNDGQQAFLDLDQGRCAAAKVIHTLWVCAGTSFIR